MSKQKLLKYLKQTVKILLFTILICSLYIIMGALLPYAYHKTVNQDFINQFDIHSFYDFDGISVDRAGLLEDPDEAFVERLRILSRAKERIVISSFAFKNDSCCMKLFSVILNAADNGVQVQILADGSTGFLDMQDSMLYKTLSAHKNIHIKIYNPINLLTPWTLNARMHDKYILVDDTYLILGGRNTSNYFLGRTNLNNLSYDRDVLVYNTDTDGPRGTDSVIHQVYDYFDSVWNYRYSKTFDSEISSKNKSQYEQMLETLNQTYEQLRKDSPDIFDEDSYDYVEHTVGTNKITLISNPIEAENKEPLLWYQLSELMKSAEYRVYIHTPYAVPSHAMYQTLELLSDNLEEYDILLNSVAVGYNFMASSDYYSAKYDLLKTGITIHEYQGDYSMHGKTVLIDDNISIIGSYNLDMRSTYMDTETMLVIHSERFNEIVTKAVKEMEQDSLVLSEDGTYIPDGQTEAVPLSKNKKRIFKITTKVFRLIRNML